MRESDIGSVDVESADPVDTHLLRQVQHGSGSGELGPSFYWGTAVRAGVMTTVPSKKDRR